MASFIKINSMPSNNSAEGLIIVNRSADKDLSKSQIKFNNYIKKINTLKRELENTTKIVDEIKVRLNAEIIPLERKMLEVKVQIILLFDKHHDSGYFKKKEQEKIVDYILTQGYNLVDYGYEEIEPIFEKYKGKSHDEAVEEKEQGNFEDMKAMMENVFGIDFGDADVSTPEKLNEFMNQAEANDETFQQEKRANRKKSEKQVERETKQQEEVNNLSKAARAIYTDLVKAFHPDREQDEAEKERKTQIMHAVTEAYQKNDLFALLKLKIEHQNEDVNAMNLADTQLKYYNKLLQEQVRELENQIYQTKGLGGFNFSNPIMKFFGPPKAMEQSFAREIAQIKRNTKSMKSELSELENKDVMRAFLKGYRI